MEHQCNQLDTALIQTMKRKRLITGLAFVAVCIILSIAGMRYFGLQPKGEKQMDEQEWGNPVEGLAISISSSKTKYRIGEPITIDIILKNVGPLAIPIVVRSVLLEYRLKVKRDFQDLSPTLHAENMRLVAEAGSRATIKLLPGELRTARLELNQGFDMSIPGSYQIIAFRETYKQHSLDQYATVISNKLTIQVMPDSSNSDSK